jgi:hypothetical protein
VSTKGSAADFSTTTDALRSSCAEVTIGNVISAAHINAWGSLINKFLVFLRDVDTSATAVSGGFPIRKVTTVYYNTI